MHGVANNTSEMMKDIPRVFVNETHAMWLPGVPRMEAIQWA